MLPDMDKSIGHPLVHYLYTGTYQTLDDLNCSPAEQTHSEFKTAVLVYATAKKHELHGLEELAKDRIEHFGAELDIHDVVETIKDEYSKLLGDSTWFLDYLKEKTRAAFEVDHTVFTKVDFFGRIDDAALTKVLAKCVMELYEEKVTRMLDAGNQPAPEVPGDCVSEVQESSFDATMTEECVLVEDTPTSADEQSILEAPAEKSLVEEPSELLVEEPSELLVEEPLDKEFPTENFPVQDIPVEEPVTAEPQLDPSAANSIAEAENEDDGWGFSFGSTAKKSKKKGKKITAGTFWDEPVIIEAPQPPQAVLPTYDASGAVPAPELEEFDWGIFTESAKKKKKSKKGAVAEPIVEEPLIEEPLLPPAKPAAPADDWGSFTATTAKKKKGKKGAREGPVPIPEPVKEPVCEPVPEPETVLEDSWGSAWGSAWGSKKGKKAAVVEAVPLEPEPIPEHESVQEPEPVLEIEPEKKEDDTWGDWGATASKKKKKGEKGALVDTVAPEPDLVIAPEAVPEPGPGPEPIESKVELCPMCARRLLDDDGWGTCVKCRAVIRQIVVREMDNNA
jgi:hypothetical protein